MHITLLKPSNAKQYRELMLEAYQLAADAFTSTAQERAAEHEDFWIKRIADPTSLSAAFGAFQGQDLLGTVALEVSKKPKTKHKALVVGMYVTPSARGKGAGRALIEAIVEYAQSNEQLFMLTLTVTEGNESAIDLYRSCGFSTFGVEPMAILTP
ncbi:GNAT family N-acetyltransferase [Limnohabitans sp.]|jgi:GNAT superfamily N-acetyltransferase|uniref:GNAT family N-acetyltransferase n=1 Tax=Limnohabitans sp. TaxID=1907725 RepID=UPI0037BEDFFF